MRLPRFDMHADYFVSLDFAFADAVDCYAAPPHYYAMLRRRFCRRVCRHFRFRCLICRLLTLFTPISLATPARCALTPTRATDDLP